MTRLCFDDELVLRHRADGSDWLEREGIAAVGYVTCIEDLSPTRVRVTFVADANGEPTRDADAIAINAEGTGAVEVDRDLDVSGLPEWWPVEASA